MKSLSFSVFNGNFGKLYGEAMMDNVNDESIREFLVKKEVVTPTYYFEISTNPEHIPESFRLY